MRFVHGQQQDGYLRHACEGAKCANTCMHACMRRRRFNLNLFSIQLGEMTGGLAARLPPSDTRWRWDLRALEEGRFAEVGTA